MTISDRAEAGEGSAGRASGAGCLCVGVVILAKTVTTEMGGGLPGEELIVCMTLPSREADSNLYGAFPVKCSFSVNSRFFVRSGKPFFVPSPAIGFAERAEGVKGPKREQSLAACRLASLVFSQRLDA